MQMNDIIDGLNSCDCPTGLQGANFNNVSGCGFGGCGFSWWIWILLILFYTNNQGYGRGNRGCCQPCCCKPKKKECCCGDGGYGNNNAGFGGCGGYLFLLVILFLTSGFGCCDGVGNGFGNGFGFGPGFDGLGGCCC